MQLTNYYNFHSSHNFKNPNTLLTLLHQDVIANVAYHTFIVACRKVR